MQSDNKLPDDRAEALIAWIRENQSTINGVVRGKIIFHVGERTFKPTIETNYEPRPNDLVRRSGN